MSIRARVAILLICLTVLTSAILGGVGYVVLRGRLLEIGLSDGRISVTEEIARLQLLLHGVREDALYLAQSNTMRDYLAAGGEASAEAHGRLERAFEVLGRAEPRYLKIRYLDLAGRERVRVNIERGSQAGVPPAGLQDQSNESYVVHIRNLAKGAVHVSRLDLNREFGQIEVPHRPTIRFVTPVFDAAGQRRGGIVINVDGALFLTGGVEERNHLVLLDGQGYYLRHRDPALTFGFDLDPARRVGLLAPLLAEQLQAQTSGSFVNDTCTWTSEACATAFGRLQYDLRPEAHWTVVHERPMSAVLAPLRSQSLGLLLAAVAAAALAGACGYLGARRITQPVDALARAAERIEAGDFQVMVAERGTDDLATLARAFNKMIASVKALIESDQAMLRKERLVREQLEATAAELARSNHDLEQFVFIASHDLKAPLRAIVQLADWLEEDLGPGLQGEVLANVHLLRGRAARLGALLTALSDYSRATQPSEHCRAVDTRLVIEQVLERLQPPASVKIEAAGALPVVAAPRGVLERVFLELIGNAIKHRDREDGHVRVSARDQGEVYQFEVEDDGPGIPARFHRRIFKIFQTLRPRDEIEGSGIGLAIVWRLLEVHGGRVSVASSPDHRGATFRFTWPKRISYQKVA